MVCIIALQRMKQLAFVCLFVCLQKDIKREPRELLLLLLLLLLLYTIIIITVTIIIIQEKEKKKKPLQSTALAKPSQTKHTYKHTKINKKINK